VDSSPTAAHTEKPRMSPTATTRSPKESEGSQAPTSGRASYVVFALLAGSLLVWFALATQRRG
jgi:hypothetical protein